MSGCGCGHAHGAEGAGHQHGAAQAAGGTATAVQLETTVQTDGVTLSDGAATQVKSLLEQEGRDDLALRIAVQPGASSSSTSAPSTATRSATSAVSTWSSTG